MAVGYGGWLGVSSAAKTGEKDLPSTALYLISFYFFNMSDKQQEYYTMMNQMERDRLLEDNPNAMKEASLMNQAWEKNDYWAEQEHLYLPGDFDLFKLHRKDMNHMQAVHAKGERFEMLNADDSYDRMVFKLFNKMKMHNYAFDQVAFEIESAENDLDKLEV